MTELEGKVLRSLISDGTIKFDVVKPHDIDHIRNLLNEFDPNLRFTVDTFKDIVPHFLDLEFSPDGLEIYRKDTNTGLYINFHSYVPWHFKIARIKSLVTRAKKICSPNKLNKKLNNIKKFISWNGFPKYIGNKIINNTSSNNGKIRSTDLVHPTKREESWFRTPYYGERGENLLKSCIKKLKRYMKKESNVYFKVIYDTVKLSYFTNSKDKIPTLNQSFVVYLFSCPGCSNCYVGKNRENHL